MTVPEVRRLLLAASEPPERFGFRLAWSTFRRRHQAAAKRCHSHRRIRQQAPPLEPPLITQLESSNLELTDERWERIAALLPAPSRQGRPAQEHRPLLEGILWVMRTGAAWREVPDRFGHWHTVYTRYRDWNRAGLWPTMRTILLAQATADAS